ncbi:DUF642 domain-containing protein [Streptomyces sp. NPDC059783]|uniref:DUF642 domain-containing protein n=1 Tax=Streptomyces sp. NPDC059783 TaxID=3346944 RepID=UPI003656598D
MFSRPSARRLALALSAVAFGLLAATPANGAAAVTDIEIENPSFKQPFLPGSQWRDVDAGSTFIKGWDVTKGDANLESAEWAQTGSSSQAVSLNGDGKGEIRQEVRTVPGRIVHLSFRLGTEMYSECDTTLDNTFTFTPTGSKPLLMNAGRPDHKNPQWQDVNVTFLATAKRTDLTFTSLVNGRCGAVITDLEAYQEA